MYTEWQSYLDESYATKIFSNFGPVVRQFESQIQTKYSVHEHVAICSSSATSGLTASLIANSITGSVIIPAFTFAATLSAVRGASCEPVIVDVDINTWTITRDIVAQTLRSVSGIKAIILVRPYGISQDINEVINYCLEQGLLVIIDNAAGLGCQTDIYSQTMHSQAIEVFSLHATKPFAIGEGGVIFAPKSMEANMRSALNFGIMASGDIPLGAGINGKISDIQGAVGLAVLKNIDKYISIRQYFAQKYIELFANKINSKDQYKYNNNSLNSPWQNFPVILPEYIHANDFVQKLATIVNIRRYYHPVLTSKYNIQDCPNSLYLSEHAVCLPIYSDMTENEFNIIEDAILNN